jgi:hypothetical protein
VRSKAGGGAVWKVGDGSRVGRSGKNGVFAGKNGERSGFGRSDGFGFGFGKGVGEKGSVGGGFAGRNGDRSGFGGNNGLGDTEGFGAGAGGRRRGRVGTLCRIGGKQGGHRQWAVGCGLQ